MNIALPSPKISWQQRLAGSRFFVTSAILHVLLLVFLWGVIVTISETQPEFISSGPGPFDPTTPPSIIEDPVDKLPPDKVDETKPESSNFPPIDILVTKLEGGRVNVKLPPIPVTVDLKNFVPGEGPVQQIRFAGKDLPTSMQSRTVDGRRMVMAKGKMTRGAEDAVLRGLDWLRDHQNLDGSWGEANKGAMTGFALLCFLGHAETGQSLQYGLAVNKAIDWVMATGTKFQGRLHMDDAFKRPSDVYEHGICTYALGEYFSMTQDRRVIELLQQAVGYIVQGQGPRGGWMYNFDKSADDLSVSGWQIQALKAAHLTGLNFPGVDAALEKSVECIDKVWKGPRGGYGYRGAEDRYSLSGVGVLCRLFIKGEHGDVSKGMDFIMDETEKNKPVKYKTDNADLYAWYYHTQAALMFGGGSWDRWNRWFQKELVDAQNADGSWPAPGHKNHGPMNEESMTGKVYRTTLCVLMLEVFYRYMPSNKAI
jgi:hypothetical protein